MTLHNNRRMNAWTVPRVAFCLFFLMCLMSALTGELHWTPDAGWREGTGDVGLTAVFVCLPACCCSRSSQTLTSSRRGHCCLGWGPSERLPLSLPGRGQMINGVMWGHVTLSRRHNLAGCGLFGAVCSRPQPPTSLSFQKIAPWPHVIDVFCLLLSSSVRLRRHPRLSVPRGAEEGPLRQAGGHLGLWWVFSRCTTTWWSRRCCVACRWQIYRFTMKFCQRPHFLMNSV